MSDLDLVVNVNEKKEEEKIIPKIIFGHVDCAFREFREKAWDIIRPQVEELANKSLGEYGAYHVHESIKGGRADLFMGYIDKTGKANSGNFQELFIECLQKGLDSYFGYIILRYDQDSVHIWQSYIRPEYQNTNVLEKGLGFIEDQMSRYSVKYLTFSSPRAGWGKLAEKLGFTELYTIYRKELRK